MMEKELHTTSADADFDARCRVLLEGRTTPAPAPRADLFNQVPSRMTWGRRGMVAAVVLASAGLWWWSGEGMDASPEAQPSLEMPASATTSPAGPAALQGGHEVMAPVPVSADEEQESVMPVESAPDVAARNTPVTPVTLVGTAESAIPDRGSSRQEDLRAEPVNGSAEAEVQMADMDGSGAVGALHTEDAILPGPAPIQDGALPATEIQVTTPGLPDGAPAEEPKAPEASDKPTLKLPLTLPSGGGHR